MELHFLRPYWFLALLPLCLLCWKLSRQNLVDNWRKICDPHLLQQLIIQPKHAIKIPLVLLLIAGIIAIAAMAGPSWHQETQAIYRTSQGTVIALNLTPSMSEKIGTTTKVDRARFKILDYLNAQKEGLTGLIVYTDEAFTISPLTEDNHTVANFIPSLDPGIMPTFNDDTSKGLTEAGKLLQQAGVNSGNIILITDKVTNESQTLDTAKSLYHQGYKTSILEIAEQPGNNAQLQKIAAAGGGEVIPMSSNNQDINAMIRQTKIKSWSPIKKTDEKGMFWHDDGRWLVFLILPLALLAFRRGYL